MLRFFLMIAAVLLTVYCRQGAFAAADLIITGRVSDAAGKPLADATVMVYHAGPTTGYSLFCPSCYPDCGKRAITDNDGMFSVHHLSPGLRFKLLVARSGYEPKFVEKVIPASDVPVAATLDPRPAVSDPNRIFRGRIVDSHGSAQRDAVVQPVGVLWDAKTGISGYGAIPGLDPIAIANREGVFELDFFVVNENQMPAVSGPPVKILVSVEARGMAEAFVAIPAGLAPYAITVPDGAVVRGRLVQDGKPIAGAEIGVIGYPRGGYGANLKVFGSPYDEIRIGTRPDGRFEMTNVPVPGNWYVYAKMASVATRGATGNVACSTKHNDEVVDVGDLELKAAYHLRGRVVLSDGKPIANGTTVTISSEEAFDSQTTTLPDDGRFEFVGLAAGSYSVLPSVEGYSLSPLPVSIEHDVDNLTVTLFPSGEPSSKAAMTVTPGRH
jgi:uncharacterized GH25 family protein